MELKRSNIYEVRSPKESQQGVKGGKQQLDKSWRKLCVGEDKWGEGRIRTKKNWSMVKWPELKRREVAL